MSCLPGKQDQRKYIDEVMYAAQNVVNKKWSVQNIEEAEGCVWHDRIMLYYEIVQCLLVFLGRTTGGFIIDSLNWPGLSSTTLSISSRKLSVTLRPVLAEVSSRGHRHFWHTSNTSSRFTWRSLSKSYGEGGWTKGTDDVAAGYCKYTMPMHRISM